MVVGECGCIISDVILLVHLCAFAIETVHDESKNGLVSREKVTASKSAHL